MTAYRIVALPTERAEEVRRTRRDEFGNQDLTPIVATEKPGYPCRHCLADAEVGEEMLLFSYSPFASAAPYRTVGPIFVHARPCARFEDGARLPPHLTTRLLSIRAYDSGMRIVASDVADGGKAEELIERLFSDDRVVELHAHAARHGCFACRIERA